MKYTLTVCMGTPFTHQNLFYEYLLIFCYSIHDPILLTVEMLHKIKYRACLQLI